MNLRLRTPLWRLAHDDVVEWIDGSGYRRSQLDVWLARHGLPAGSELAGGSVCALRDWRGREWLYARRLDGRPVRARLLEGPPARLPVTAA